MYNGQIPFAKGCCEEAIPWFTRALRADPKCESAYDLRGQAFMATGKYQSATRDFDSAIRLSPNNSELKRKRAEAYEAMMTNQYG